MKAGGDETADVHLWHDQSMDRSTTAAAIVAGGGARRFNGQDKGRLVVEGRTIIVRQVEILQRLAAHLFVVSHDPARYADLPVTVVPDRVAGLGAIGGIDAAVHAAGTDRVIVVACDLPFLTAELLGRLVDMTAGHDGAWVRTSRGVEPLVACYAGAARARIAAQIAAGRLKAADLGDVLRMAELASPELDTFGAPDRLLANVNTPGDYARVQYGPA
jgi:molybdopterin-guanine dinucleotide biosynthesis protein A